MVKRAILTANNLYFDINRQDRTPPPQHELAACAFTVRTMGHLPMMGEGRIGFTIFDF
jgi:hypothetical protein